MKTLIELILRQVAFRIRFVHQLANRRVRANKKNVSNFVEDVVNQFRLELNNSSGLVLVHASLATMVVHDASGKRVETSLFARQILYEVNSFLSNGGTVLMPTQPLFRGFASYIDASENSVPIYNPTKTVSGSGLLSELFRRSPGVVRDLNPINTLAGKGPSSGDVFADSVLDHQLPHGKDSTYYRAALRDAKVIALGLPLIKCMTSVHIAEEVDMRDDQRRLYTERNFLLEINNKSRPITLLDRRREASRIYLLGRLERDLVSKNLIQKPIPQIAISTAQSRAVMEFMLKVRKTLPNYPMSSPFLAGPFSN